jgi:hypothetical protein
MESLRERRLAFRRHNTIRDFKSSSSNQLPHFTPPTHPVHFQDRKSEISKKAKLIISLRRLTERSVMSRLLAVELISCHEKIFFRLDASVAIQVIIPKSKNLD